MYTLYLMSVRKDMAQIKNARTVCSSTAQLRINLASTLTKLKTPEPDSVKNSSTESIVEITLSNK